MLRSTRFLALTAWLCLSLSACVTPRSQAAVAQALNDAADAIDGLRSNIADLQTEIDSLRDVVTKQDSTIARMAAVTGIQIVR